jgi:hypothetical protein
VFIQRVGEGDPRLLRRQQCESRLLLTRDQQVRPLETIFLMPLQFRGAWENLQRHKSNDATPSQKKFN